MTSAVSKSDIEDELWKNGIRSKAAVSGIMRLIEIYAAGKAHAWQAPDVILPLPVQELAPGESDAVRRVTRCISCGHIKKWKSNFPGRAGSPTGYGNRCKICISDEKPLPPGIPDDLFFPCRDSLHVPPGESLHASRFYRRSDTGTGFGYTCIDCQSRKRALDKQSVIAGPSVNGA